MPSSSGNRDEMRFKHGHVLRWTCFLCILLVANENIILCIWSELQHEREVSLSQCAHTSLSLRLLCSTRAHTSLSASALFSMRTHLSLSLSLSASAWFSVHTPLSASALFSMHPHLSICICSVQRAHTSLSLSLSASALFSMHPHLSICICSVQRAHTSLSLHLLGSACAHTSFSASALFNACTHLSLCVCFASRWNELRFQLKHWYVASLILHANIAEITALLSLSYAFILFDFIRRQHDYKSGFLCRLTSWKGELFILMGCVSVTISYSWYKFNWSSLFVVSIYKNSQKCITWMQL